MNKILFINTTDRPDNAVSRIIGGIRHEITQNGWSCDFAVGRHANDGEGNILIGNKFDTYYHALHSRLFDTEGLCSHNASENLIRHIQKEQYDILHIHNLHGHYIHYPTLFDAIRLHQIPTVITLHDCWLLTGHCATYYHNIHSGCNPKRCGDCRLHYEEYPYAFPLLCNSKQRAENARLKRTCFDNNPTIRIVTVSDWLHRIVQDSGIFSQDIRTIHNGVDTNIFNPMKVVQNNGKFKILFITSNWESWKGLQSVVNFYPYIRDDEEITLIGNLMGQKIPSGIKHIANIGDSSVLANIYNEHDLFISPSIAETFGMTTAEAIACGLPVIVNNSAALPELIKNGYGIVTDTSNPENIRHAVDEIRTHTSTRPQQSYFTAKRMAKEYELLYKELLLTS